MVALPVKRCRSGDCGARTCLRAVVTTSTLGMLACQAQPPPLCPDVYSNVSIPTPAATFTPSVEFSPINASTAPGARGVTVSIVSNQGMVSYAGRGPFQAFLYERIGGFPDANSITYGGLGVEPGTWFPFWLVCSIDGRLTQIQGEMTDRSIAVLADLDGTCTDQGVGAMHPVSLEANVLSPIALSCGFSVHGPTPGSIDLEGSQNGSMTFFGDDSIALPFYTVDCRESCGTPGWYELHTMVWDQASQVVGFQIVYLDHTGVYVSGAGIALPSGFLTASGHFPGATFSLSR
jgi:hypothetical protein